jgi:hypothetical protein
MSNTIERYSPEWNEALRRFVDAGQRLLANNQDRAALAEFSEAGKKLGFVVPIKSGSMVRNEQETHGVRGSDPEEVQGILDDVVPIPKAEDTVIFADNRREKIQSVSEAMVRIVGFKPIPVTDLKPSGEPDTWIYKGNTLPRAFPVTMVVT